MPSGNHERRRSPAAVNSTHKAPLHSQIERRYSTRAGPKKLNAAETASDIPAADNAASNDLHSYSIPLLSDFCFIVVACSVLRNGRKKCIKLLVLIQTAIYIQTATRKDCYLEKRFCKHFSVCSPCLPGQQDNCRTSKLSENSLQNIFS